MKTVMVGDTECAVQTLREWLNERIASLRRGSRTSDNILDIANFHGRLTELLIVREKLNDGRIQEIG